MKSKIAFCFLTASFIAAAAFARPAHAVEGGAAGGPAYLNPDAPLETRVADLLSRLTLEEKTSLMSAGSPAIPRLGITEYNWGNEALHGVLGEGFTVFPQAIALAATWDPALIKETATAISDEAWGWINGRRDEDGYPGRRYLSFWSPTVNMARDPRWGRTPETYGEDPHLTASIGVAFVKGLQGDDRRYIKAVSTPKHFAANNEEHNRFRCDARISERMLREYYFPGFKALIQQGGAQSVMAAYNAVNGVPCNADPWLLTDVLRGEWGFEGYVVTDCGALARMVDAHKYAATETEAGAFGLNAGVDIECGDNRIFPQLLIEAHRKGLVSDAAIDRAVSRLLRARMKLGMFDPPERNPYTRISPEVVASKEHQELARRVSQASLVLLKNDAPGGKPMLPLNPAKLHNVAVVGPGADKVEFGDYTGKPKNDPVTVLEGIRNRLGDKVKVERLAWIPAPGRSEFDVIPKIRLRTGPKRKEHGLRAEYFRNAALEGEPALVRVEDTANLNESNAPYGPSSERGPFSARWTGDLIPEVTGAHYFYVAGPGASKLFIDGRLTLEKSAEKAARKKAKFKVGEVFSPYEARQPEEDKRPAVVMLEKGKRYALKLEYASDKGNAQARLEWAPPSGDLKEARAKEFAAVRKADVTIAVIGLRREHEHESVDRVDLDLPEGQEAFVRALTDVNPDVVAVLVNGSSVAVNELDKTVPAILESWYSGEQGGNAIADALFGDYNPGGRLPLTFYKSVDDLPPFDDYDVSKGRTHLYFEGKPLYPFGHGLSYTRFEYGPLTLDRETTTRDGYFTVSFDVTNAGDRAGDEVAQLYFRDVESSVKRPVKQLAAFERFHLEPGETKRVTFALAVKDLAFWDETSRSWTVEPGDFELQAGASSADIRSRKTIAVKP